MDIFAACLVFCCLSLYPFTEAVPVESAPASDSDTDVDALAKELLDVYLNKKSIPTEGDDAEDEEVDDKNKKLDMRILSDILDSDQDDLRIDLEARMSAKQQFNTFVQDTFGPDLFKHLVSATHRVPDVVKTILVKSGNNDFACRLADSNKPKWLKTLRSAFPTVVSLATSICEGTDYADDYNDHSHHYDYNGYTYYY